MTRKEFLEYEVPDTAGVFPGGGPIRPRVPDGGSVDRWGSEVTMRKEGLAADWN